MAEERVRISLVVLILASITLVAAQSSSSSDSSGGDVVIFFPSNLSISGLCVVLVFIFGLILVVGLYDMYQRPTSDPTRGYYVWSGSFKGNKHPNFYPVRTDVKMRLLPNGVVDGSGYDNHGHYTISGEWLNGMIAFCKNYEGKSSNSAIHYTGVFNDSDEILSLQGEWVIENGFDRGNWKLVLCTHAYSSAVRDAIQATTPKQSPSVSEFVSISLYLQPGT